MKKENKPFPKDGFWWVYKTGTKILMGPFFHKAYALVTDEIVSK